MESVSESVTEVAVSLEVVVEEVTRVRVVLGVYPGK